MVFLSLLLVILGTLAVTEESRSREHLLIDKSFSLKTIIKVIGKGSTLHSHLARLTEKYSITQKRAWLQYNIPQDLLNADFYYDATTRKSTFLSRKLKTCSATRTDYLYYNLFNDSPQMLNLFKLIQVDQTHLIGPCKLLFFLTSKASEMKLSEVPNSSSNLVEYELDLPLKLTDHEQEVAKLTVTYRKFPEEVNENDSVDPVSSKIPVSILVSLTRTPLNVVFTYYDYELLPDNRIQSAYIDLVDLDSEVLVDEFSIPPSFDCASLMGEEDRTDLFASDLLYTSQLRFSFTAHSRPLLGRSFEHFVAFDGPTQMVRIDSRRETLSGSDENKNKQRLVLDLKTNRRYTVSESDDRQQQQQASPCIVTHAFSPRETHSLPAAAKMSLSNFLLAADKFTYLGEAQVRGIKARVYESYSSHLPYWFSQPTIYRDQNGDYALKQGNEAVKDKGQHQPERLLCIVVYISSYHENNEQDDEKNFKRLLQLDVYDRRVVKTSSFRRILSAQIYDFVWRLSEPSETNDRPLELFSLRPWCSSSPDSTGGPSDSFQFSELSLLLSERDTTLVSDVEVEESNGNNWLNNWSRRNAAVLVGLRQTLGIQSVMIYDLESKLIRNKAVSRQQAVAVTLKVAEHKKWIHKITFMGNAEVRCREEMTLDEICRNNNLLHVPARSLLECVGKVWPLVKTIRSIYVLYSETNKNCMLSSVIQSDESTDDTPQLKEFYLSPLKSDELYKVEIVLDSEIRLRNTWLTGNQQPGQLENRPIDLIDVDTSLDSNNPKDFVKFEAQIYSIRIRNFNNICGKYLTKLAGLRFPNSLTYSQVGDNADLMMTRDQCQLACMVDTNCNSFTYCLRPGETNCYLYNASFSLTPEQVSLRRAKKQTGMKVQIENNGEKTEVELINDLRCDLYGRKFLDLFLRDSPITVTLKGLQIVAVSSEEQCAALCFARNLDLLQASANLSVIIENLPESETSDSKSNVERARNDLRRSLAKLCRRFLYLSSSSKQLTSDEQRARRALEHVPPATGGDTSSGNFYSYCAFERQATVKKSNEDNRETKAQALLLKFDTYNFQFAMLYERQAGFGLSRSLISHDELNAYSAVSHFKSTDSLQHEILERAISEGKNFQLELISEDPAWCARQCFSQTSGPWPMCRSFDEIVVLEPGAGNITRRRCLLNSQLGSDKLHLDKARLGSSLQPSANVVQAWHYEPRFRHLASSRKHPTGGLHVEDSGDMTTDEGKKIMSYKLLTFILGSSLVFGLFLGVRLACLLGAKWKKRCETEIQLIASDNGIVQSPL